MARFNREFRRGPGWREPVIARAGRGGWLGGMQDAPPRRQFRAQFGRAQIHHFRRNYFAFAVVIGVGVPVFYFRPVQVRGGFQCVGQHPQIRGRRIIKQRTRLREKQRQEKLGAGRDIAGANFAVDFLTARVAFKMSAKGPPKMFDAGFGHGKFARRQQFNFGYAAVGALRVGVKITHGFDFIVKQIKAKRGGRAHWKNVNQIAAHREFPRRQNLPYRGVIGAGELRAQRGEVNALLFAQRKTMAENIFQRRQSLHRIRASGEQNSAVKRRQLR